MCEERTVASANAETCRLELTTPPFRLSPRTLKNQQSAKAIPKGSQGLHDRKSLRARHLCASL